MSETTALQRYRREVGESDDMNESDKRDSLYVLDIWLQGGAEEAANAEEYAKKADEEKKDEQMRQEKQELDQHVEDILKRANGMQKARSPFFTVKRNDGESKLRYMSQKEHRELKEQWQKEYDQKIARVIAGVIVRTEKRMEQDVHTLWCENQVLRDNLKALSDENESLRQRLSNATKKRKRVVREHEEGGGLSTF